MISKHWNPEQWISYLLAIYHIQLLGKRLRQSSKAVQILSGELTKIWKIFILGEV